MKTCLEKVTYLIEIAASLNTRPVSWIKTMATAFVVGNKFRNKVAELLEKTDSSLPQRLREELEESLEKTDPTVLSFSAARKLKKYLQDEGKSSRVVMIF